MKKCMETKLINNEILSVIVLSYNNEKYIYQTLDSIMLQTIDNIEIIIADDCSSFFDSKRIKDYLDEASKNKQISYKIIVNNENVGTVKNINNAIKASKGEFIKIIAGDDIYPNENVFKEQINYLKTHSDRFGVMGFVQECDQDMNIIRNRRIEIINANIKNMFDLDNKCALKEYLKDANMIFVTQAVCFRKSFFEKYGLFDEDYKLIEDMPMGAKILINKIPFGSINKIAVNHRCFVGVSASNKMFSKSRIPYYNDIVLCYQKIYVKHSNGIHKIKLYERMRANMFRVQVCYHSDKRENKFYYFLSVLKYLDAIVFYVFSMPIKTIKKVLDLIKLNKN